MPNLTGHDDHHDAVRPVAGWIWVVCRTVSYDAMPTRLTEYLIDADLHLLGTTSLCGFRLDGFMHIYEHHPYNIC